MKRFLILGILAIASLRATVITGQITDLTGQIQTSNRSVVFTLENCGNNIPTVVGSSVITPPTKTFVPNAAGLLAGTLVGNDIISCGTTIGQTWYQVQIFSGSQQVYEKLYAITGATWNIATAVPLSNDPTSFLDIGAGYQLGDMIYGSGTNTLGLIRGNQTTTVQFLCQQGRELHRRRRAGARWIRSRQRHNSPFNRGLDEHQRKSYQCNGRDCGRRYRRHDRKCRDGDQQRDQSQYGREDCTARRQWELYGGCHHGQSHGK